MRTPDMDLSCTHSSRFMKLFECDCLPCMCTYVGSNPCRELSLLDFTHPVEGSLFQVQGVCTRTALARGRIIKESQIVALGIRFV